MELERIHPDVRRVVGRLPRLPFHHRRALRLIRWLGRLRSAQLAQGVELETASCGAATARVYRPQRGQVPAALLWVHGGGFVVGSARADDSRCSRYARDLGVVVVSVDYRLAPQHPFPAAVDDCLDAWRWLMQSTDRLGVDPHRIAIAGESAGGGLAAALVQRIFDLHGVQPAAQLLLCPMLDDRTAARRELDGVRHWVWDNRANRAGWSAYLAGPPGGPVVPDCAVPARRGDFAGLPPTRIGVGDIDLFLEEDQRYCERLIEAGVVCELDVVPMAPHGFQTLVPTAPLSIDFEQRNDAFLRHYLGIDPAREDDSST